MKKIPIAFYRRKDVVKIAKELLGKLLVTNFEGKQTIGRIVETEAYNGVLDRAAHSYNGRRTNRTEIMYANGGVAYVYLCYGIHHLFNVVTHIDGDPKAVLIRALEPVDGIDIILERMRKTKLDHSVTRGPGNLSRAMGINVLHSGQDLSSDVIYLADDGKKYKAAEIGISPRIGVDYAGEDALLPYRFFIRASSYISGTKAVNANRDLR